MQETTSMDTIQFKLIQHYIFLRGSKKTFKGGGKGGGEPMRDLEVPNGAD